MSLTSGLSSLRASLRALSRSTPRTNRPGRTFSSSASPALKSVALNDGHSIPVLGYGTGTANFASDVKSVVETAHRVGYHHIDTAEAYRNEWSVGAGLHSTHAPRDDIYLTTKLGGSDPQKGIASSLKALGMSYVDLYLIHTPTSVSSIQKSWLDMEHVKRDGFAKSVGVSNYRVKELEDLMKVATYAPAVNQIEFHPYVFGKARPLLDFCHEHGIVIESYGPLSTLTRFRGGPVDGPVAKIAQELGSSEGQVLLKWAHQVTNGVVLTTSSKEARMRKQLEAFTKFRDLDEGELDAISKAGLTTHRRAFTAAIPDMDE